MKTEISPAEAVKRLREYFPASQGYDVTVDGGFYSYSREDFGTWPSGVSEGFRFKVHVTGDGWHFSTSDLACLTRRDYSEREDKQSVLEAVEELLRFWPASWIPAESQERQLFAA